MGILDWVFGLWKQESRGLFNEACQHWRLVRQALLSGHQEEAQAELLEVVRLCQESIKANPQKEGDAYVLLANALLRGHKVYQDADEELLVKYAAACIHFWSNLPYNKPPITSRRETYDLGLRWHQEVVQKLGSRGSADPEATIAKYRSLYGALITSTSGFDTINAALENLWQPDRDPEENLAATLWSHWNRALHGDQGGTRADLSGTDLSDVDLSKERVIKLFGEGLGNGRIRHKELNPTVWRVVMGSLAGADFSGATLSHANFKDTGLSSTAFTGANLSEANLSGADLMYAELREANLTRADITGADLRRADLMETVGLTEEQIKSARTDEWTALPAYLKASSKSEENPA